MNDDPHGKGRSSGEDVLVREDETLTFEINWEPRFSSPTLMFNPWKYLALPTYMPIPPITTVDIVGKLEKGTSYYPSSNCTSDPGKEPAAATVKIQILTSSRFASVTEDQVSGGPCSQSGDLTLCSV